MRWISEWGRSRGVSMAVLVVLASAFIIFAEGSLAQKPVVTAPESIEIQARELEGFDRIDHSKKQFGRLEWRGGLVLSSPASEFGGWSGLVLDADGRRLVAISDSGAWMTADLSYRGARPAGLRNAKLGPLRALDGNRLRRGRDRDAEAVTLADGNLGSGTVLISFEHNHRIGRFRVGPAGVSEPLHYLKLPAEAKRMDNNAGFESVSVLQGGRFKGSPIAFSERLPNAEGHHTGWIWVNGESRRLHLTDMGGYDITDAAPLRDGGLLVLERRFRWTEGVKMRLRLLKAAEILPGAIMQGEVLLEADMSSQIDNMEAVSVHYGERGETVVTLMSDDNFNTLLQRTLLLQFTLLDDARVRAGR